MAMKINGIELPEEFNGGSTINNIVVTRDGTKYAVVRNGRFETKEMPADGKLNIDGNQIQYTRHSKGVTISSEGSLMNFGGLNFSNSSINIGKGMKVKEVEEEREEIEYTSVKKVIVDNTVQNLTLGVSKNDRVKVKGFPDEKQNYNNTLALDDLEGTIELPESRSDLEVAIESTTGNVTGVIKHPGSIKTSTGRIKLDVYTQGELYVESSVGNVEINLYTPLAVDIDTSIGKIKVSENMWQNWNGHFSFIPVGIQEKDTKGKLTVETSTGSITINYKGPTNQESEPTPVVQKPVEEVKTPKKKRHNPEITEEDRRKWEGK